MLALWSSFIRKFYKFLFQLKSLCYKHIFCIGYILKIRAAQTGYSLESGIAPVSVI